MPFALPSSTRGHYAAFFLVLFTSFQATFLFPDTTLVLGERTNLFTALLCTISLAGAWLFTDGLAQRVRSRGFWISLGLIVLGALSIATSPDRVEAFYRGSVALFSALGGYWCGRIVLADAAWRRIYAWFCLALLAILAIFCIGGVLTDGNINDLLNGTGKHPLANRIMLLWFAPLLLIVSKGLTKRILAICIMLLSYAAIFISGLRTAVLMPIVLGLASIMLGVLPLRWVLVALAAFIISATAFFVSSPEQLQEISSSKNEEIYYRVENIPFSLHIISKHPWLGIGLRTDRSPYYEDYNISLTAVDKRTFKESMQNIVTSENSIMTLFVGMGIPFTLLYIAAVAWTYGCLMISVVRLPSAQSLAMLGLFLPITAGITYFQLYDGIMYPQVVWFFHLLLGMAPRRPVPPQPKNTGIEMGEPVDA